MRRTSSLIFLIGTMLILLIGCGKNGNNGNPFDLSISTPCRQGMWFNNGTKLIFGGTEQAADVDLAAIEGMCASPSETGDIFQFTDGSQWLASCAIVKPIDEGAPYPMVRFLKDDGATMSDPYKVTLPNPLNRTLWARTPRIAAAGRYDEYDNELVDVYVAYSYGGQQWNWNAIQNWDVYVTRMIFEYNGNDVWSEIVQGDMSPNPSIINSMTAAGAGALQPDIVIEPSSSDIYVAWTSIRMNNVNNLLYERYDDGLQTWTQGYTLKLPNVAHFPWFVNIDTGLVDLPGDQSALRRVAFTYTGQFSAGNYLGCHPVVGWWSIQNGPNDGAIDAEGYVYNSHYGTDYDAGMSSLDIPGDSATNHNAALVFVQDVGGNGSYDTFGVSSNHPQQFVWVGKHDYSNPEFITTTLPSVAVNRLDDNRASVAFLAADTSSPSSWGVWGNQWDLDNYSVTNPTQIDVNAEGEFNMSSSHVVDFLFHAYGSASSIVYVGGQYSDSYWVAWSDKYGNAEPVRVNGSMGFANN